MRSGLIAKKLGMSSVYDEDGTHLPVTVLLVDKCQVVASRSAGKDGYTALQLGVGEAKIKNVTKPMRGHYAKAKVTPKRKLVEFRVSDDGLIEVGAEIAADHFLAGQYVDVVGTSKGKGFAGGIKRHHFSGMGASHGVSVSHRALGSTGQCQDPGKVFKGKKMPGQMGNVRVTTHNLQVVSTDRERGLILIKGAVPGSKGGYVLVRDAIKKRLPEGVPMPGALFDAGPAQSAKDAPEEARDETAAPDSAAADAAGEANDQDGAAKGE